MWSSSIVVQQRDPSLSHFFVSNMWTQQRACSSIVVLCLRCRFVQFQLVFVLCCAVTREKVLLSLWFKRQNKIPPTVSRIIIDLNDANDEFIVLLLIVRCQKLRQLFLHYLIIYALTILQFNFEICQFRFCRRTN